MSTVNVFNGNRIIEPGFYARIIGTPNVNVALGTTGNVCIIDTGSGAGYGGGSGIAGTNVNGKKAIYTFSDLISFRAFVKGGLLWDLAEYLFNPSTSGPGVPLLHFVRANTTTPGTLTYTFTGGGSAGGTFVLTTKDEGLVVNGATAGSPSRITRGIGAKMFASTVDVTKYYIEFYLGNYKGVDASGEAYDGISEVNTKPILISRSIDFKNVDDLFNWVKTDSNMNAVFNLTTTTKTGAGTVDAADLAANTAFKLVVGGTETYNATDVDTVLENITELDNSFFLADQWGSAVDGTANSKILTHIANKSEFGKTLIMGGANDATDFATKSIGAAQTYNSENAVVVHSGIVINSLLTPNATKNRDSIYHAALVCGRLAGLQPFEYVTYKALRIKALRHELTKTQRETALQAGVLHTRFVPQKGFVVNQDVNTLQNNTQLILPSGETFCIGLKRIKDVMNKELVMTARINFTGSNIATLGVEDIKSFIEQYLKSRTSTKLQPNYIISGGKVSVKIVEDYFDARYEFIPNGPINKGFFTGIALPINFSS